MNRIQQMKYFNFFDKFSAGFTQHDSVTFYAYEMDEAAGVRFSETTQKLWLEKEKKTLHRMW